MPDSAALLVVVLILVFVIVTFCAYQVIGVFENRKDRH